MHLLSDRISGFFLFSYFSSKLGRNISGELFLVIGDNSPVISSPVLLEKMLIS